MIKQLIILLALTTYVFANLADFTKNSYRTFNDLEGKVPTIKITINETDYNTLKDVLQLSLEKLFTEYGSSTSKLPDFETKVTMTFELDGNVQTFKKVDFKTGGQFSRTHDKGAFNLKLKKNDVLYNRKTLRLRADPTDPTHIRSKLSLDLLNNWNIPSVQTAYVELYINEEYYGLYMLLDAIKPNWIQKFYNISNTTEIDSLFQCKSAGMDFTMETKKRCKNDNSEFANYTLPYDNFLKEVSQCKTLEDLDKIMDTELFMKNIVVEYLYGSYDHILMNQHNFYLYRGSEEEKWQIIQYDFDSEFGNGIAGFVSLFTTDKIVNGGTELKFENFIKEKKPIYDILYFNDNTLFVKILRELLVTGFNPDNLFPRVDELIEFIAPYVEKTVTPDANGEYPGVINKIGNPVSRHNMTTFYGNAEFEYNGEVPGVKAWIQGRFDFACKEYGFDKEEILKEAAIFRGEKLPSVEPSIETETIEDSDEEEVLENDEELDDEMDSEKEEIENVELDDEMDSEKEEMEMDTEDDSNIEQEE